MLFVELLFVFVLVLFFFRLLVLTRSVLDLVQEKVDDESCQQESADSSMRSDPVSRKKIISWLSSSVVDTRSPMVFRVTGESIN